MHTVLLHPVAFAAWLGLFLTFLNLLPFGQLDGGHILHALSSSVQCRAAQALWLVLIPLGTLWWGWWLWAGLVLLIGRGRLSHPKVLQPGIGLGRVRTIVAWSAIVMFFLTFVPLTVRLVVGANWFLRMWRNVRQGKRFVGLV
jgi:membrane-associated protease RseP (regulator of RpoE activity)